MANELFELLKKDHREAKQMMQQATTCTPEKREELFIDISDALRLHMEMEEQHFYPKLQDQQGMIQLMKDALKEHAEAKQLLTKLDRMDCQEPQWMTTFRELQKGILHHVQEEEQTLFPKCSEVLSEQQFTQIAQKCRQMKETAQPTQRTGGKQSEKRV